MSKHTMLHDEHVHLGGKMVDFAGWEMPLHYGSQIEEHHAVRNNAGAFDVSHMTVIDVWGQEALPWLQHILANDVGLIKRGEAQYGLLLNSDAGIIDDLIVYQRESDYRLIVNAGTREKVLSWFEQNQSGFQVNWKRRSGMAIIAVQGPRAIARVKQATGFDGATMSPFTFLENDDSWMIARTGYTGESGLEIVLPEQAALELWQNLMKAGVVAVGLAARDTLRLEAGMSLSGQDMDETTHAMESALGWTIAWKPENRSFIGRESLEQIRKAGSALKLCGIVLQGRGVLRHGQKIISKAGDGTVTSGIFSPTLGYSIGLARVPKNIESDCQVEIRGKKLDVKIVRPPFVRNGQKVYK
jgi:aminomethyltransferase